MNDVKERLRNIVAIPAIRRDLVVSVRRETVEDAVAELERLESLEDVKTGMSWMDSCDALTAECFRHKAEIERLQGEVERLTADREGEAELKAALVEHYATWWNNTSGTPCQIARLVLSLMNGKIDSLACIASSRDAEIKRLQADVDRLMPLTVALGECNEDDLPLSVVKAWREPSSYRRDELVRISEQLAVAEGRQNQELREARADIAALIRDRDRLGLLVSNHAAAAERLKAACTEAEETALRRWNVANKQQMELERLRKAVATLSDPARLAEALTEFVRQQAEKARGSNG